MCPSEPDPMKGYSSSFMAYGFTVDDTEILKDGEILDLCQRLHVFFFFSQRVSGSEKFHPAAV